MSEKIAIISFSSIKNQLPLFTVYGIMNEKDAKEYCQKLQKLGLKSIPVGVEIKKWSAFDFDMTISDNFKNGDYLEKRMNKLHEEYKKARKSNKSNFEKNKEFKKKIYNDNSKKNKIIRKKYEKKKMELEKYYLGTTQAQEKLIKENNSDIKDKKLYGCNIEDLKKTLMSIDQTTNEYYICNIIDNFSVILESGVHLSEKKKKKIMKEKLKTIRFFGPYESEKKANKILKNMTKKDKDNNYYLCKFFNSYPFIDSTAFSEDGEFENSKVADIIKKANKESEAKKNIFNNKKSL